jgi:hypothetical protein
LLTAFANNSAVTTLAGKTLTRWLMKIARRSMRVEGPSVAVGDIAFNLLIFFVNLAQAQDDNHSWKP